MGRLLKVRKPTVKEFRQLNEWMEEAEDPRQRRRCAVLVYHYTGFSGQEIAAALGVHPNTVYADLLAFAEEGLASVRPSRPPGVRARLDDQTVAEIGRIAESPPYELGLPNGRWSLATLRAYLLKQRTVRKISREHLRQLLKKGGSLSARSSRRCSAPTRSAGPF